MSDTTPTTPPDRLTTIQSAAGELFYRMEHTELDELFLSKQLSEISHVHITNALRRDALWLATLLGQPERAPELIADFQERCLRKN